MAEDAQCKSTKKGVKITAKTVTREKIEETKKKCLQIVENLIEPSISEDLLINLCKSISQDDYVDAVEERNILQLCGYPLCSKTIKILKQKYHISLKSNKVYDITERKCFCSNVCYKASNFLKAQLPSCPMWLKEKDSEEKPISLLNTAQNSGSAGEEVNFGHTRMTENDIEWVPDEESQSESIYSSFMSDGLESCATQFENLKIAEQSSHSQTTHSIERTMTSEERDQDGEGDVCTPKSNKHCVSVITEQCMENSDLTAIHLDSDDDDFSVEHKKYELLISNNKYMPVIPKLKARRALLIEPIGNPDAVTRSPSQIEKINNSLQHIQDALATWISIDTFCIILGESKFEMIKNEVLEEAEIPVPDLETNSAEKLEALKQTYAKICVRLEREEDAELNSNEGGNMGDEGELEKPCDDNELEKLKVSMFYKGKMGLPETPTNKKKAGKKSKPPPSKSTKKESTRKGPIRMKETQSVAPSTTRDTSVLPVVESMSQDIIRRQIVADHLKIVYLNMLPLVGLHYRDISEDFRLLIATFCLSSTNISFKPHEWKMMAVILFRMIETKLTTEKVWSQEKCWELLKEKLVSFGISLEQIDVLLSNVTDHSRLKTLLLGC